MGFVIVLLAVAATTFSPDLSAHAATVPLDRLADHAMYHTEQNIKGYNDVEKIGYKDVEKTGYHDVEVPVYDYVKYNFTGVNSNGQYCFSKDNNTVCYADKATYNKEIQSGDLKAVTAYRNVTKYRTELYKVKQPYKVKEPVYKTSTAYSAKQTIQGYTKTNSSNKLTATNSKGKKYNVTVPKGTKVSKVNRSTFYKGTIHYTSYKKQSSYITKQTVVTGIRYVNAKGKKVSVSVPRNTIQTYKNGKYYSTVKFSPYKKIHGKWVKQKQVSKAVQVNKRYVKTLTRYAKETKSATVYIQAKYVTAKTSKIKTCDRTVTKYKDVNKTRQVPYTAKEKYMAYSIYEQIGSNTESQPYTYTEQEPYTYTEKEPIYETIKVENTLQVKYQTIVNYYWPYRLTESELNQLFDHAGVKYTATTGNDLTKYVLGSITVNGSTTYYRFNPYTNVKLVIFDDGSAINLSYLFIVDGEKYNDVKIGTGGYVVK